MDRVQFGLSAAHIDGVYAPDPSTAGPGIAHAFDRTRALGLDAVEFFITEYTVAQCREIRSRATDANLAIDYHAGWDGAYDFGLSDRRTAFLALEQAIARAHLMGARHLVCHLGRYDLGWQDGRERAIEQVIGITRDLLGALDDTGVVLCYENNTLCHDPNPLGDSPRDFALLFDAVDSPRVGMCLDTGHANVTGNPRAYLEQFGRRIRYVHLNDNDGIGDTHVAPSAGTIDWTQLFEWLSFYRTEPSFGIEFNERFVPEEMDRFRELADRPWHAG